ncbi:MAG: hypothetical protein GC206_08965 [Alphaproteobacteria bacterium]|nr:hypothetical protein [Alphaproteobacteria bacterium]
MALHRAAAALACAIVASCATGPVNTANPSTGDLLFRWGDLNAYLDQRRAYLETIRADLRETNALLARQLEALAAVQEQMDTLHGARRARAAEVAALEQEVQRLEQQAIGARTQLTDLERRRNALEQRRVNGQGETAADAAQLRTLQQQISQLRAEIGVFERGIQNTHAAQQRALLSAE